MAACRRQQNWDYYREGTYLITLALAQRNRPILGEVVAPCAGEDPQKIRASFRPTGFGFRVQELWQTLGEFHPGAKPVAAQLMPDHFHGILWMRYRQGEALGDILRGFKIACTKACREMSGNPDAPSIWESGFHDRILSHPVAIERAKAYLADNPRRLAVKRLVRNYFTQHRQLKVEFPPAAGGGALSGVMCALGNIFLLDAPHFHQIQVSRRDFRYRPAREKGAVREPEYASATFEAKREALIQAAESGAVAVSPFISQGEQALCRFAVSQGYPVIQLRNQGLPPLFKPGGELFNLCTGGKYLLLAPGAWPYTPAKKPMTRTDALILNRITQGICGADAAEINYRGAALRDIDLLAQAALT